MQGSQGPTEVLGCGLGQSDDCELGAEVLAALRFAAWPAPPPQTTERRRLPAPASTASHSHTSGCDAATDSDCEGGEHRPRKVRVVSAGSAPGVLTRRTYTWRGVTSRRAEKQQRQLDAQQQQQQQQACSPTHSSGSADTTCEPATQQLPAAATLQPRLQHPACSPVPSSAAASGFGNKEGHRAFAALTTWLRMNLHQPRTAKKAVQFVGRQDSASGRWSFVLNPVLSWADVSPDTRQRLHHLPAEALHAFCSKYPRRPAADWRLKTQQYKPAGSSRTHLVQLEDLVLGLHAVYLQHEHGAEAAALLGVGCASVAASLAAPTSPTAEGPATPDLASCGTSTLRLA